MKKKMLLKILLVCVGGIVLSITHFTDTEGRPQSLPLIIFPEVQMGRVYSDCGLPEGGETKGYLGWPFAGLGSQDYQSCGGNSSVIYKKLYPFGVLLNIGLVGAVWYSASALLDRVRTGKKAKKT